ncbi:MAG: ABC transporter permease, partial [Bacteroidota bacterium]
MRFLRPTNFKIAFSHLTSRVKQALVAVLSVTFGISMYVFMNSFMNGVNETQNDMAFSTVAHIHIFNDQAEGKTDLLSAPVGEGEAVVHLRNPQEIRYTEGIRNSQAYVDLVKRHPAVKAVAPEVNLNVFFRNGATKVNGLLSGIEHEEEEALFNTSQYLIAGDWNTLGVRSDGIALGSGLAARLGVNLYDNISLQTADGVTKRFTILGIFRTSINSVDDGKAYVRINSARQLVSGDMSYATDIQ